MEDDLLELRRFDEGDIDQLCAVITDPRLHLEWTGPEYTYPLDARQLQETLAKTRGQRPSFKAYKAVLPGTGETVGHVQLMDIDYAKATCVLGKVLIFPPYRGRGLGKALVRMAVNEAFVSLGLRKMTLLVFDFNEAAIATYRSLGFVPSPPDPGDLMFEGESWHAIAMTVTRERWSAEHTLERK